MANLTPSTILLSSGHQLAVTAKTAERIRVAITEGATERVIAVTGRFIIGDEPVRRDQPPGGKGEPLEIVLAHVVAVLT